MDPSRRSLSLRCSLAGTIPTEALRGLVLYYELFGDIDFPSVHADAEGRAKQSNRNEDGGQMVPAYRRLHFRAHNVDPCSFAALDLQNMPLLITGRSEDNQ